ncbi:hypothetical protein V1507DRAFT_439967 [Lipomyces tetrasporus]
MSFRSRWTRTIILPLTPRRLDSKNAGGPHNYSAAHYQVLYYTHSSPPLRGIPFAVYADATLQVSGDN